MREKIFIMPSLLQNIFKKIVVDWWEIPSICDLVGDIKTHFLIEMLIFLHALLPIV